MLSEHHDFSKEKKKKKKEDHYIMSSTVRSIVGPWLVLEELIFRVCAWSRHLGWHVHCTGRCFSNSELTEYGTYE